MYIEAGVSRSPDYKLVTEFGGVLRLELGLDGV